MYPLFSTDAHTTGPGGAPFGYSVAKTASSKLTFNPSTGIFEAPSFKGKIESQNDGSTNATMYPLFMASAGSPAYDFIKTSSAKFTFNPLNGILSSTSFYGKFQSANDTSTNATMYPLFMASAGSPVDDFLKTSSSKFTFNPSTGALGATTFNGAWGGASALTKTDDTNVTLTLGGTPATALLQPTSITAGWTGQLSRARGGTGSSDGSTAPTIGGGATAAVNASGQTAVSASNGGNTLVAPYFRSIVFITNVETGDLALYLMTTAGSAMVSSSGGNFVAPTTSPTAGKMSLQDNGSTGFSVYNNRGGTSTFKVWTLQLG